MSAARRIRRLASLAAIASVPVTAVLPLGASAAEAERDDGAGNTVPLADSHFVTDSRPDPGPTVLKYDPQTGDVILTDDGASDELTSGDSEFVPTGQPIFDSGLVVRG